MYTEDICRVVGQTVARYGERDPYDLLRAMHILLLETPMGSFPTACKGFFMVQSRIKVIAVNSDLSEEMQRVIVAHELGHAVMHYDRCNPSFREFSVFEDASRLEREANFFAAELLISDEDVFSLSDTDISFFGIAGAFSVPPQLLDFKLRAMKSRGINCINAPMMAGSRFLRSV